MGKTSVAWTYEISDTNTGKLHARDYSLGIFVNLAGKPIVPASTSSMMCWPGLGNESPTRPTRRSRNQKQKRTQ